MLIGVIKAKDVIFSTDDLKPFFGQFLSLLQFIKLSKKHKLPIVDATTIDIEYNHIIK